MGIGGPDKPTGNTTDTDTLSDSLTRWFEGFVSDPGSDPVAIAVGCIFLLLIMLCLRNAFCKKSKF